MCSCNTATSVPSIAGWSGLHHTHLWRFALCIAFSAGCSLLLLLPYVSSLHICFLYASYFVPGLAKSMHMGCRSFESRQSTIAISTRIRLGGQEVAPVSREDRPHREGLLQLRVRVCSGTSFLLGTMIFLRKLYEGSIVRESLTFLFFHTICPEAAHHTTVYGWVLPKRVII